MGEITVSDSLPKLTPYGGVYYTAQWTIDAFEQGNEFILSGTGTKQDGKFTTREDLRKLGIHRVILVYKGNQEVVYDLIGRIKTESYHG